MYDVTRMAAPNQRKSFCQVSGVAGQTNNNFFRPNFDHVLFNACKKNMHFIAQNIPYNIQRRRSFAFGTNPFISQCSIRLDSVDSVNIFLTLAGIPLSRPSSFLRHRHGASE